MQDKLKAIEKFIARDKSIETLYDLMRDDGGPRMYGHTVNMTVNAQWITYTDHDVIAAREAFDVLKAKLELMQKSFEWIREHADYSYRGNIRLVAEEGLANVQVAGANRQGHKKNV